MWRHVVPMPTSTEPNQWAVVLMQRVRKNRHISDFSVNGKRLNPLKLWPQMDLLYNPLMITMLMMKIMIIYTYEFCRMIIARGKRDYMEKNLTFLNHKMLPGLLKGWTRASEVRTRPVSRAKLRKGTSLSWSRDSQSFTKGEGSLPCSQEPPLDPI
jgi:hypothetical protein